MCLWQVFEKRASVQIVICFFFQAEDGIRDYKVTGVQTCALPISFLLFTTADAVIVSDPQGVSQATLPPGDATWSTQDAILVGSDTVLYQVRSDGKIGRASCRERV